MTRISKRNRIDYINDINVLILDKTDSDLIVKLLNSENEPNEKLINLLK